MKPQPGRNSEGRGSNCQSGVKYQSQSSPKVMMQLRLISFPSLRISVVNFKGVGIWWLNKKSISEIRCCSCTINMKMWNRMRRCLVFSASLKACKPLQTRITRCLRPWMPASKQQQRLIDLKSRLEPGISPPRSPLHCSSPDRFLLWPAFSSLVW